MAARKNALEGFSKASSVFHAKNLASATKKNVVPKFTNRLRHCIRYGNIMGFSLPNFLVYGQDPRKNSGKYGSKETCIFLYFNHCDVSCLLTQKRTHFCTRIIVLKIAILREMFS